MSRQITPENFEDFNEEMIRKFNPEDFHNHPSPIVRLIERRRVDVLLDELDVRAGQHVLEVGCGAGNILERIHDAVLYGIDISDFILERARKRLGRRADIRKGNAEALPYPDQTFDRVFCSEVLEHVMSPRAVMAEMRRVVKHNGVVVASVPNEGLINSLKDVVFRTGPLGRALLGAQAEGYKSVERMDDEWHLHAFDEAMLRSISQDFFHIQHIRSVPLPGLPLRFVARLIPR